MANTVSEKHFNEMRYELAPLGGRIKVKSLPSQDGTTVLRGERDEVVVTHRIQSDECISSQVEFSLRNGKARQIDDQPAVFTGLDRRHQLQLEGSKVDLIASSDQVKITRDVQLGGQTRGFEQSTNLDGESSLSFRIYDPKREFEYDQTTRYEIEVDGDKCSADRVRYPWVWDHCTQLKKPKEVRTEVDVQPLPGNAGFQIRDEEQTYLVPWLLSPEAIGPKKGLLDRVFDSP